MVREDEITSIRIAKSDLERLKKHGEYGDSMASIVAKILDKLVKLEKKRS
jgi:hypothetical protein